MTKNDILKTKLGDGQVALFYLGQEGFLIKYNDKYIITDAYLSDYVDRNCCSENVTWKRLYPAPIDPKELDFVDYVFCSHGHYDHADPDTLSAVTSVNGKAKYIVPAPIAKQVASYGVPECDIIAARDGDVIKLGEISAKVIPSAHEQINYDENGDCCEVGYRLQLGDISLYHAGDCCIYDGLSEKIGHADIALLPVNGRDYYRLNVCDIVGNMDSREAVILAESIGAQLLVPLHFDLYDCNRISAAQFTEYAFDSNVGFHIFKPGERYIFAK